MKNNRSITITEQDLLTHPLSKSKPPENALFWKLWNACFSIAQEALNTKFVQGIKNGTLDPVTYGSFNVSDAYYCFKGAEAYQVAANKTEDPVLKAFLTKKHNSYESYNKTFPKTWHLKGAEGIVPTEVCQQYANFEATVAQNEAPIYCLIVMLPCEYLWAWLGAELSPPAKGNLYADWITGNDYPSGAYAMGNFLEAYRQSNPVDETKALQIYKQAITYEWQNFATA